MNLEIQKFNPNFLQKFLHTYGAFSMIITGNTKAGKSHMMRYLLTEHIESNYFDFVIVFSRTLVNGYYNEFIESKLMFSEYNEEVINTMIKLYEEKKSKGVNMKWLVILDDCVDNRSKFLDNITHLFYSGRHYNASIIFLTQKISLMNTGWINNASIIISLFAYSRNEKEYLSENVIADALDATFDCSTLKSAELKRLAYNLQSKMCDTDYNAIVVIPFSKLESKIFKFRADKIKNNKKMKFAYVSSGDWF